MFLGYHVDLGIRSGSSARDNSSINYGAIFLLPIFSIFKSSALKDFLEGTMR